MKNIFKILAMVLLTSATQVQAANDTVRILRDSAEGVFTAAELEAKAYAVQYFKTKNPAYSEKELTYEGVDFSQLLVELKITDMQNKFIVVTCLDGYRPVIDGALLSHHHALLATKENPVLEKATPDKKWSLVKMGEKLVSPGPFYLVWDEMKETYPNGWPFQVAAISIVNKKDFADFRDLAPTGAFNEKTAAGHQIFMNRCSVCHSIRYVGPKGKAPDLAYVVRYRNNEYIANTIRTGRGVMPSFKSSLKETEIQSLIAFLQNQSEREK